MSIETISEEGCDDYEIWTCDVCYKLEKLKE